jgi:hypothetical protein
MIPIFSLTAAAAVGVSGSSWCDGRGACDSPLTEVMADSISPSAPKVTPVTRLCSLSVAATPVVPIFRSSNLASRVNSKYIKTI